MSSPSTGSSGSSGSPVPGYYPDPSIPGYIRYWNGGAWVPGTSRPAPRPGEELAPPPGQDAGGRGTPGPAASAPASGRGTSLPAVEESGVMFFDEDPVRAQEPTASDGRGAAAAPVWSAAPAVEPPRTTWGAAEPQPQPERSAPDANLPATRGASAPAGTAATGTPAAGTPWGTEPRRSPPQPQTPEHPQPHLPRQSQQQQFPQQPQTPQQQSPQQSQPAAGEGTDGRRAGSAPLAQAAPAPWAQQVHELARQGPGGTGPGTGTGGGTAGGGVVAVPGQQGESAGVVPWRPPVNDPFASMVQEQGRPAGLGRRLAARLLDTVIVLALTGAAAVPLGTAAYHHLKDKVDEARQTGETVTVWLIDGTTGVQLAIVVGVALVAGLLYEVLPTAKWGRTLGKKLFGLRVVDIESQLAPGFGPSLRRWLTHTVLDALVIGVVGLVWCMIDRPWRQCWHDKAARTFVARQ
ncbi:RDD family protein [Streptomyces sp. RKAG293]|uniref:RDD family protein n=1 Tax=Streptomyces sp. RKAG293 TaxID=2893403 RepID=UPI002033E5FC|nr:RDD family protein [Streptomyces sp. RKAG293]MCM2419596.1 RDD family protein [Streptomyces sp. RKAG293]